MAEAANTDTTGKVQEPEASEAVATWNAVLDSMDRITDAAIFLLQQYNGVSADRKQGASVERPARVPSRASLVSPMPAEVQARAQALEARQQSVIRQLEEAQLDVARQLQAVSSIPGIGAAPGAVYLDVTG